MISTCDVIQLLPDHVANQIVAVGVVHRPASVVKELIENAVDAGATEIDLIVKDAGRTLIQVVDNGKGMSITDLRMAFERHATSKIQTTADKIGRASCREKVKTNEDKKKTKSKKQKTRKKNKRE